MRRDNTARRSSDPLTVLIVEDNERICDLFETWLAAEYEVQVAYDGDEALQSFDRSTDIILLDRRMPSMSGDEVLETIRDRGWEGQVIMVTAVEPSVDVVWMDFDDYIMKPVDRDDLLTAVEKQRTIRDLESQLQEYLGLVAKRQALEDAPEPMESLEGDDGLTAYNELVDRIAELEQSLKPKLEDLDEEDILATGIRDLWYDDGATITQ